MDDVDVKDEKEEKSWLKKEEKEERGGKEKKGRTQYVNQDTKLSG